MFVVVGGGYTTWDIISHSIWFKYTKNKGWKPSYKNPLLKNKAYWKSLSADNSWYGDAFFYFFYKY